MTESEREAFRARAFEVIRANIARRGYHAYRIDGGPSPRWVYTIGLHETHGAPELVVAGALYHHHEDVADAIGQLVDELPDVPLDAHETRTVEALGEVDVVPAHPSWVALLLLGAIDFYGRKDVRALQLRPRGDRRPSTRQTWARSSTRSARRRGAGSTTSGPSPSRSVSPS